jgi:predicted lipoprotein with Yx(FWY)xxD motif
MIRPRAGVFKGMKKLMVPLAAGVLAVTLAACGGSSSNNSSSTPSSSSSTTSSVLKDASGMALYSPTGESATNIRCTGQCTSIWMPLRPGQAKLTGATTITRPDGTKQLVVGGKPLYTFVQDSAGKVTGNGAKDAFSGKQFTWHAVQSGGTVSSAPASTPSSSSGGGGYGSSGY